MQPYAIESLSLKSRAGPLHRRLYAALRDAILDGSLAPGTRLPATRRLAGHLAVSRNTVVAAFDQLHAEGYVTAKVGHGTRVAAIAPEKLIACSPAVDRANAAAPNDPPAETAARPQAPRPRIFEAGEPDVAAFPHHLWARLLARSARDGARLASPYVEPFGDPALRGAIARHVQEYRGVRCRPEQVVVTTSTQAAMTLTASLLLRPGDPLWLEDPGYIGALAAFEAAHARIIPVPVDSEGMDTEAVPDAPPPKLIYLTPSHQFPLGMTMPLSRRLSLLERASQDGAYIIEDDYDSEFRFSGRPVAALQGIDSAERVIYLGTFSKTLMPGLRTAYMVLPRPLCASLRDRLRVDALQPPAAVQAALAQFVTEGHYAAHVRRMRMVYARRLKALENAACTLPRPVRLARCSTGLQVPLYLGPDGNDKAFAARGERAGLSLSPISKFYLKARPRPGVLLGFAAMPEERITEHMATLGGLLRERT